MCRSAPTIRSAPARLPELAVETADVTGEDFWLQVRGIVATRFCVHVPLHEVLVVTLGEAPDAREVAGEPGDAERDGGRLAARCAVCVFVIEPDRGTTRVGEPVQADAGQDEVLIELLVTHRIGGHELCVPAEQADGGVGEGVRQRLRLLRLQLVERHLAVHEPLQLLHRGAGPRTRIPAARG